MSPNILAVIKLIMSLLPVGQTIMSALALISRAQAEGRDVTDAELADLRSRRKKATQKFLDSLPPAS